MPKRSAPIQVGARALSVDELADAWGVSDKTIWNYIRAGRLPTFKVMGRVFIPMKAVEAIEAGALGTSTAGVEGVR